jgi:hypothetical protein
MTILITSSVGGGWIAFASSHVARIQTLRSSSVVKFDGRLNQTRSSTLNFTTTLLRRALAGDYGFTIGLNFQEKLEVRIMKKAVLASVTAAAIGISALMAPSPAQAWRGGWGPGLAGGLIAGALIGGIASSAYAYGPGYGYYGAPGYGYGGYAPAYYGAYGPAYYGGYGSSYYAPAYYGPRYRRVIRPAYAYGPRYYGGYGW